MIAPQFSLKEVSIFLADHAITKLIQFRITTWHFPTKKFILLLQLKAVAPDSISYNYHLVIIVTLDYINGKCTV